MENEYKDVVSQSNNYVRKHREYVEKAFNLLYPKLLGFPNLTKADLDIISQHIKEHDLSKFEPAEAIPYASFFWGTQNDKTLQEFKLATKLHKSRNLHHPEYWMSENGQTNEMPLVYVIEMVCDWWSFGLMQNNPMEIFTFYANNKSKYKFSNELTTMIEDLLSLIKQSIHDSIHDL